MRRRAQSDVIPEDLQVYDWTRWVQAAIDAHEGYIAHIPVTERPTHWYVVRVIAPTYYRAALWEAVGQRRGDAHFYDVLEPCPMGSAPAGWVQPTNF
jgi:hypothetical protein